MSTVTTLSQSELQRKLARIHNRPTLYELVVSHPDGRRYLVAYCGQKNRRGIWAAVTGRAQQLVKLTGDESIHFAKRAADGGTMGEWSIRFSGRTERESFIEGELPYVGRLAETA